MYPFAGKGILLDIEGTTSSVHFVFDVMFPFVRRELDAYLRSAWGSSELSHACDTIASDAGHASFESWCGNESSEVQQKVLRDHVRELMDADIKATGLKELQGLIWEAGFTSGEMKAHLYEDVLPAIQDWSDHHLDVRIYSSGSIAAQKLFFGHTIVGNVNPLFKGYYDTTTGLKKESESYTTIANAFGCEPKDILFISDIVDELKAAASAGMQAVLSCRPGNAAVDDAHRFPEIHSFDEIKVS